MSLLLAKVVIVGIPLLLSLAWFVFWVVRIARFQARKRAAREAPRDQAHRGSAPR